MIPAYQAAETIRAAITSVINQPVDGWELIVVDDGSTDATSDVVAEINDARVRMLTQPNGGVSAARNTGIEAARGTWLLFLDADDRLTPDGLAHLANAIGPGAEWLYGSWARSLRGEIQGTQLADELPDALATLQTTCPFAIHACLVRRERVLQVGGFDPSFTTCEDWDLWLRLAQQGVRPEPVDAVVAEYVVRGDSASMAPHQLLSDGLRVIAGAHRKSARPTSDLIARQAEFRAYVAGIVIGQGGDPSWVLADGVAPAPDVSPAAVADMLHAAVPLGAMVGPDRWPSTPSVIDAIQDLLTELERATGARELERRCWPRLAGRVASGLARTTLPRRIRSSILLDLDLAEAPFAAFPIDDGVERVEVRGWLDGAQVAHKQIIPLTDVVHPTVLLDGLLEEAYWPAAERFLLPKLRDERVSGNADWALLTQAVFGQRPAGKLAALAARLRIHRHSWSPDAPVTIEVTDGPAEVRGATGPVVIEATLGGEFLDRLTLVPERGRVTAHRLRHQLTLRNNLGLAHVAMRSYLSRPVDAREGTSRSVLGGAATGDPAAVGVVRLPPTGLPLRARQRLFAARETDIFIPSPPPQPPIEAVPSPGGDARRSGASFDALFASAEDPWGYETGYERRKYEQTLSLVPSAPSAVLELACAEGHFTERLASVAGRVVATDVSDLALERARARCAGSGNVEFLKHDLFADTIEGLWPVIVCSEVLYYAGELADLDPVVQRIVRALEPGGVLVTGHANLVVDDADAPGFDWGEAFGALGIQHALLATGLVALEEEILTPMYRVQRYRRRSGRGGRPAPPVSVREDPSDDLSPDVRAHFLPTGGKPASRRSKERVPRSVPILMYHRVAPTGSADLRRWRLTPDEFASQLSFLQTAGYSSITLEQWRDAVTLGLPLPSQPVVLTFDDGYADFFTHALPLLQRHGFGATLFAVADLVGEANTWNEDRESVPLMDWQALGEAAAAGIEIGAHTCSHPALTALSPRAMLDEVGRSITTIGSRLGRIPTSFAYPYGDLTPGLAGVVALGGAQMAVTCEDRIATDQDDLLLLPRIEVRGDTDPVRDLADRLGDW